MNKKYTVQIYGEDAEVTVTYYAKGRPEKINCLPEDAYPEEPAEVDWIASTDNNLLNIFINNDDALEDVISEQLLNFIEDRE